MSNVKGDIWIKGWEAREIDGDTYLVTYSYLLRNGVGHSFLFGERRSWPFEVQLSAQVVRYVIGDQELEHKYGWGTTKK